MWGALIQLGCGSPQDVRKREAHLDPLWIIAMELLTIMALLFVRCHQHDRDLRKK